MFILKLPIASKSYYVPKIKNKKSASRFTADIFLFFKKIGTNINILSFDISINEGTEINISHQPKWSQKRKKEREAIFNFYSEKFFDNKGGRNEKYKHKRILFQSEIDKFNKINLPQKTINGIYELFKGSNATGAEGKVSAQELVLNIPNSTFYKKQFINLLKTFTKKSNIKYKKINNKNKTITWNEFLNMLNDDEKYILNDIWFNPDFNYYYIKPWKEWLNNSKEKFNSKLKQKLISKYDSIDHLYKKYKNTSVVQGCHLKPKVHIIEDKKLNKKEKLAKINDINNGLLLPAHIHKYFDSGEITFKNDGTVKYTTSSKAKKPLTKSEVEILDLNSYKLDKDLLNPERLAYIKYHRDNVYQNGI